jgi:phosphomannomutase
MDLFGTAGIRGDARETVTPSLALQVGMAVGDDADRIVVGRDGRTTGSALADAVAAGAQSAGALVSRVGRVPTSALAFASRGRHGVMCTASHNPPGDNGLKLFADGREYDSAAEQRVAKRIEAGPTPTTWDGWGEAERQDILDEYRHAVDEYARDHGQQPAGTVVVDCGNGTAALGTPQVLRALGTAVTTLHANVDGHFPGRESKPTAESLTALRRFVADDEDAIFGVGHDGDADRIVVVDSDGAVVHEDTILAILAAHFVRQSAADDPVVVTTPNASARIDDRVRAAGGRVERARLGYIHEGIAAAEGTVVFAGEPWKHIHPALGPWMDAVATAAVLSMLVGAAGGLETLRAPVTERPYVKRNVSCPDEEKTAAMERLRETLVAAFPDATAATDHGVRLTWPDDAWALVRPSGTEPYLRVYVEADAAKQRADEVVAVVEDAV